MRVLITGSARFVGANVAVGHAERDPSRSLDWCLDDAARVEDQRWRLSDIGEFQADYPDWRTEDEVRRLFVETFEDSVER